MADRTAGTYANNPRLHSAADVERIAASILKWGWTNPVLVDEQGVLIAGHGTVAAAAKLGLMQPIPVIVARGWSELLFEAVMRDGFGSSVIEGDRLWVGG